MTDFKLHITKPRPYFAELPYYLWGRVNYDSEGDCKHPRDRDWTWIELTNRETGERVEVNSEGEQWVITGVDLAAERIAYFLQYRCQGRWIGADLQPTLQDWNHPQAAARAASIASSFQNEALTPFAVGHMFWGSWKWIGWFSTEFTWGGRWIMDAVVRNDPRAVNICIEWLRSGTYAETQSEALRYALNRLTGQAHITDRDWINWYDLAGGITQFPEPDFDDWFADLKSIYGE